MTVTWLPGNTSRGAMTVTTGGVRSRMTAVVDAVFVAPRPSLTVSVTRYELGVVKKRQGAAKTDRTEDRNWPN